MLYKLYSLCGDVEEKQGERERVKKGCGEGGGEGKNI